LPIAAVVAIDRRTTIDLLWPSMTDRSSRSTRWRRMKDNQFTVFAGSYMKADDGLFIPE
jgi:hypothetical protein